MDNEKINSIDHLANTNDGNLSEIETKTENFMVSAICLVITIFTLLIFALFVATNSPEAGPDASETARGLWFILASLAYMFVAAIAFPIAFICSLVGFFCGRSSIKHLPTKKLTVWAKIITYANLAVAVVLSIPSIYLIYSMCSLWF